MPRENTSLIMIYKKSDYLLNHYNVDEKSDHW